MSTLPTPPNDDVWVIRPPSVRAFIEAQRDWVDACFDVLEDPPSEVQIDAALHLVALEIDVHVLLERERLSQAANQTISERCEMRIRRSHAHLKKMVAGLLRNKRQPSRLKIFAPIYRAQYVRHIDLTMECLVPSMNAAVDEQDTLIDWHLMAKSVLVDEHRDCAATKCDLRDGSSPAASCGR